MLKREVQRRHTHWNSPAHINPFSFSSIAEKRDHNLLSLKRCLLSRSSSRTISWNSAKRTIPDASVSISLNSECAFDLPFGM